MVLKKLPGAPQLFAQKDVRETTTSPKEETSYNTVSYRAFHGKEPDTDTITLTNAYFQTDATVTEIFAGATLPNGAVVKGVIVYGNDATNTGSLTRNTLASPASNTMASSAINTEATGVSNATIDNSKYSYGIKVTGMSTGDRIYGARITYTLGL